MKSKSQLREELISRRQLIKYMAGGMAGSLLLPSLMPQAFAQTVTNKKVVFVYAEAGATHRFMDMRPAWFAGQAGVDYNYKFYDPLNGQKKDNGAWSFNFTDSLLQQSDMSQVLAPLYPLRDKLTYLEGLTMASTGEDHFGDAHATNHLGAMSGTPAALGYDGVKSAGSTPSIDQRINDFIRLSNPAHNSLNYRMNVGGDIFHEFLYYNADRTGGTNIQRLPVEINPQAAFDRVFAPLSAGNNGSNTDQAKIFQMLDGSYTNLSNRLSSTDKARIDTHRALLSDLSNTMSSLTTCGGLSRPTVNFVDKYDSRRQMHIDSQVPTFEAFARMVASGFSCGLSRVASIGIAVLPPELYGLPQGTDIHHEYEHPTDPTYYYSKLNSTADLTDYLRMEHAMRDRNIWQVQQLKKLADIFAATPDPSGMGTLLDSTLIVYVNELSHGNHGADHWPVILLGGFDGAITPGRYIKYAQNIPNPYGRNYGMEFVGPAQTKLFISIMQAFGMNIDVLSKPYMDGYSHPTGTVTNAMELRGSLSGFKI
jgi:Protein of unknown function (DUF1552)